MSELFTLTQHRDVSELLFSNTALPEIVKALREGNKQGFLEFPLYTRRLSNAETLVSPEPFASILPDKAEQELFYNFITATDVYTYFPAERFDKCTQLIKVMGCEHCPMVGDACVSSWEPAKRVLSQETHGKIALEKLLLFEKKTLQWGEYAYVHPGLTRTREFQPVLRSCDYHEFAHIKSNQELFTNRSKHAAETRKGQRVDCSRCLFGYKNASGNYYQGCDSNPRRCHGPFGNEEAQITSLTFDWDERVEKFLAESEFTRGQFWTIAKMAGIENRVSRRMNILSGWRWSEDTFTVDTFRSLTEINRTHHSVESYGEVRELFPDLPRKRTYETATPTPLERALWYASLESGYVYRRSGWGSKQRVIVSRRIDPGRLHIRIAADSYIFYSPNTFTTLGSLYAYLDRNPAATLTKGQK